MLVCLVWSPKHNFKKNSRFLCFSILIGSISYFTIKMFNFCRKLYAPSFVVSFQDVCQLLFVFWGMDCASGRGPHPEGDKSAAHLRCVSALGENLQLTPYSSD